MEKIYLFSAFTRLLRGFNSPSSAANERRRLQRGETLKSLTFREAIPEDITALAGLHVAAWNDTYPGVRHKPTLELREFQWEEAFSNADDNWFCYVIENKWGELVGFAEGNLYAGQIAGFDGQLNKIYLLRTYQRMGLGRKLMGYVARRFLSRGIFSMLLFAEPDNPSREFYEVLGAERILSEKGEFKGAYGWRDLQMLAEECPIG